MTAPRWLVTCSCGYERECISQWAATATAKLHVEHLGDKAVPHHITITEDPRRRSMGHLATGKDPPSKRGSRSL